MAKKGKITFAGWRPPPVEGQEMITTIYLGPPTGSRSNGRPQRPEKNRSKTTDDLILGEGKTLEPKS